MFCEHCGKELDDDSRFCEYCGVAVAPVKHRAAAAGATFFLRLRDALRSQKKTALAWALLGVALVFLLGAVVISAMPRTIVLDDYITVRFEGLSTLGTARLELDEAGFLADLSRDLPAADTGIAEQILQQASFSLQLENNTALSNGDKVYINFSCNTDILEAYDLRIRLKRDVRQAEGLQEPEYLDPFEQLRLSFAGCPPYTEVILTNTSGNAFIRNNVLYNVQTATLIAEGSKFTVEATFSEEAAIKAGYIITEKTREYTATDLPQPKPLQVFDQIQVSFSGVEGEGLAAYTLSEGMDFLKELRFVFNKESNLKEGDVVTLSYTNPHNLDPLQYGYTFSGGTAKSYTVTKLGTKIATFSQIPPTEWETLLKKVDATARHYLTKNGSNQAMQQIQLVDTGFANGNELSHAAGTSNVTLLRAIAAQTGSRNPTRYLIFVYNLDITGHPNITKNNGDIADACVYFYIKDPVLKGDDTLDLNYEINGDIICKTSCYLNFDALEEAFLKSLTPLETYTPQ